MLNRNNSYDKLLLVSIELTNFKSFEGHHIIGPYLGFTAVVGPNGGGKLVKGHLQM